MNSTAEVEMVARSLDLYWRSTCEFEPDADHEITWHSFIGQAQAAIAALGELNELLNKIG